MKKIAIILIGFLTLAGCATSQERAEFHSAQLMAIQAVIQAEMNRKPMIVLEGIQGQPIQVSGLSRLEVYAPSDVAKSLQFKQFHDEYVPVYIAAANLLGIPIGIAVQGYFTNELMKTAMSGSGGSIYYGDNSQYQGITGGNGIGSTGNVGLVGRDGSISGSIPTTTTITTTTGE